MRPDDPDARPDPVDPVFGGPLDDLDDGRPRRDGLRWLESIDAVLDRTGLTLRGAAVVALVFGLLVGAILWLLREPSVPVDDLLPVVDPTSLTPPVTDAPDVVAHVAGAVARPGVVRLPAGSRVVDALDAAGGPSPDADLDRLNLAAVVSDGSRVYVPRPGEVAPESADGADGAPIDLNVASVEDLDGLPGIGPATAQAIVDHRARRGPFRSVDGLLEVRGIGEAKLARLRPLVRV